MIYLSFCVTRTGIRPITKKVEAIVNMDPSKNQKYVRSFIVLLNYSRDIWAKRSHLLQPLTELTSKKVKFKWTVVEKKSFDEIKRIVAHYTLLIYTDFNKRCDIHTDASEFHIGAVISQDGKPIAFYGSKLIVPQTQYKVTVK